ncbi:hypothetical protein DFS34DRAFT_619554 [Phlyctochytrium arcticum]|nr:hypothetical protein DFS34DRAFT_619554 [Phlyctochytrium arcticum]
MLWYDQEIAGDYVSIAIHPNYSLIAAAYPDGRVNIYDDEGRNRPNTDIVRVAGDTKLRWHPARKLLAACWSNGTVGIWSEAENVLREGNVHASTITVVEWSPSGNRLITGDEDGDVVVWKTDPRGRLSIICQYRLNNAITHCVFRMSLRDLDFRSGNSPPFFLSASNGSLHYADDMGHCTESAVTSTPIAALLMMKHNDTVVAITDELMMHQYHVTVEGKLTQKAQMKVSSNAKANSKQILAQWAGPTTLALSVGWQPIWVWDIENEENTILDMGTEKIRVSAIAYSYARNTLIAGTDAGHVIMWKGQSTSGGQDTATQEWQLVSKANVGGPVQDLDWGGQSGFLGIRKRQGITILSEQILRKRVWGRNAAVQVDQSKVIIYPGGKQPVERTVDLRIRGLALSRNCVAVWSGTVVEVQEYSDAGPPLRRVSIDKGTSPNMDRFDTYLTTWNGADTARSDRGPGSTITFPADTLLVALDDQFVYLAKSSRIDVCNHQGSLKTVLTLPEGEGDIIILEAIPGFLLVVTSRNYLKLFSTQMKEPKPIMSKQLDEKLELQAIISAKCNCNGTMISFSAYAATKGSSPYIQSSRRMYVFDVERDTTHMFNSTDHGQVTLVSQYWDWDDARILVCQAETSQFSNSSEGGNIPAEIFSFFVTPEHGIVLHDITHIPPDVEALFGIYMPFHYYYKSAPASNGAIPDLVETVPARDFEGLENTDASMMRAIIDFSYHLATGNMDESLKALKLIKSPSVWKTMAKMCVKTKRTDVAMLCLSNLGNAAAVQELQELEPGTPQEVRAAIIATHLDMNEDVEAMYLSCQRHDLLNKFYQSTGQWEKALKLATTHDRIHLRTTFHRFGQYLEEIGDVSGAVAAFEKSATHDSEIPRMLLARGEIMELERYIGTSNSKALKKWWAQFAESQGDHTVATKLYKESGDTLSIVRMLCIAGNIEQAIDMSEKTNDLAAYYHIARVYEGEEKLPEALAFYAKATCYSHAIRLAKESRLDSELMHLALQGSDEAVLDVARYFEKSGRNLEKAISLYQRGGNVGKAIDLCFQIDQPGLLEDLVQNLSPDTDSTLLQKCAAYFISLNDYVRAVTLLMMARKFDEALQFCVQHGIGITEQMADSVPVPSGEGPEADEARATLIKVADYCMEQGSYHLACKKYTQAGDRMKAMRALLKSGDTEKILFFANVSGPKQREIFVLAANYLQTMDWRNDRQIMKAIITFYTKAKALESLSGFYEACAQLEIDEYQNYEKGLAALKESLKCLMRAKDTKSPTSSATSVNPSTSNPIKMVKINSLQQKIDYVARFVEARGYSKTDTVTMMKCCEELLALPELEEAVRLGDIYALMIETHHANGYIDAARELLSRLRTRMGGAGVNLEYYIDKEVLKHLEDGAVGGEDDGEEFEEEDVADDL